MRLVIFGATGRTGIPLIQQALAAGHEVVAFARTPSKIPVQHERLTSIQGEIQDAAKVAEAIKGADAVLNVLGPNKTSGKAMLATAAQNIVAAMQQHRVQRLVSLTGAGIRDEKDEPKVMDRVMGVLLRLLSAEVLKDSENAVATFRNSGLDWTIVRGPMLTEGPQLGKYRVGYVGKDSGIRISRADVAAFMLKLATESSYLKQMPMVSD